MLEYEQLKGIQDLQVILVWNGVDPSGKASTRSWTGLVESDFELGGSATYSSPYEELAQNLTQTMRGVASAGTAVFDAESWAGQKASDLSNTQIKSLKTTANFWEASERPTFPVNFTLLNYKDGMDVGRDATDLVAKCYPGLDSTGLLTAPGGYRIGNAGDTATGVWSIRIGRWFAAHNLNLLSASVLYSKTLVQDSESDIPRPLTATIAATLQPFQQVTETTVSEYYIGGTGESRASSS